MNTMNPTQSPAMHTPTPWRRHQVEHDAIVESKTGFAIANVYSRRFSDEVSAANLAFIVEACNAYAANQRAIAELREALTELYDLWEANRAHWAPGFDRGETASRRARAALANSQTIP